jgi:hypothetical protein
MSSSRATTTASEVMGGPPDAGMITNGVVSDCIAPIAAWASSSSTSCSSTRPNVISVAARRARLPSLVSADADSTDPVRIFSTEEQSMVLTVASFAQIASSISASVSPVVSMLTVTSITVLLTRKVLVLVVLLELVLVELVIVELVLEVELRVVELAVELEVLLVEIVEVDRVELVELTLVLDAVVLDDDPVELVVVELVELVVPVVDVDDDEVVVVV